MPENISDHITYDESVHSNKAEAMHLNNVPGSVEIAKMKLLACRVFEPLREYMNEPINVDSFYRCIPVNRAVGGVDSSQHVKGEAIDICCTGKNMIMFNWIKENLDFDQLIREFGTDQEPDWIHVSFKEFGNRKQVYKSIRIKIKGIQTTKYIAS
jgi:zinc D-Ala-D-Ala carboxypeptidase